MILWTIQPDEVMNKINRLGVYHCDPVKARVQDMYPEQYDWLAAQMRKRIGLPPEGVSYPVWAWYQWRNDRRKPGLHCTPRRTNFLRVYASFSPKAKAEMRAKNWEQIFDIKRQS